MVVAAATPVLLGWGAAQDAVDENRERVQRSMAAGLDWNALSMKANNKSQTTFTTTTTRRPKAQRPEHS